MISKSPAQACSPELSLSDWAATAQHDPHLTAWHRLVPEQGLDTHINNLSEIALVSLNLELYADMTVTDHAQ